MSTNLAEAKAVLQQQQLVAGQTTNLVAGGVVGNLGEIRKERGISVEQEGEPKDEIETEMQNSRKERFEGIRQMRQNV